MTPTQSGPRAGSVLPKHAIEAGLAAVQVVPAVVPRQVVLDAVDRELALGDAVRKAADQRADWVASGRVAREIVRPKGHIGHASARSGTSTEVIVAPCGVIFTRSPWLLVNVYSSTTVPSGILPKTSLPTVSPAARPADGLGKPLQAERQQKCAEPHRGNEGLDRHRNGSSHKQVRNWGISTFGNPLRV